MLNICKILTLNILIYLLMSNCSPKNKEISSTIDVSKQIQIFNSSSEEVLKPTMWDTGDTTISNEDRYELFQSFIKNLKGGYIGVGSTQNFTFAAWAKSEWIWMMDFTNIVVTANKIHAAFIKRAKTPEEFQNYWQFKNQDMAYKALEEEYKQDRDYTFIKNSLRAVRPFFLKRVELMTKLSNKRSYTIWFKDIEDYTHIRNLILNNRVRFLRGDITANITVMGIGKVAKEMGVPVRIFYFSNAEEYLKYPHQEKGLVHGYSDQFKQNWISIPTDNKSLVLRSYSQNRVKFTWPEDSGFSTQRGFHYNIISTDVFKKYLSKHTHVSLSDIMNDKNIILKDGYSTLLE